MTRAGLALALLAGCGTPELQPCEDPIDLWLDQDGDGFGDPLYRTSSCGFVDGWVANDVDCDDHSPTTNPLVHDACEDGVDADCDGVDPWCASDVSRASSLYAVRYSGGACGDAVLGGVDVDRVGGPDVIVGVPLEGGGQGAAYIMDARLLGERYLDLEGGRLTNGGWDNIGASLAWVSSPDGVSQRELAIGAPSAFGEGAVAILRLPLSVNSDRDLGGADRRILEGGAGSLFGASIADGGDVDADEEGDLIIGAPAWDRRGAAWVITDAAEGGWDASSVGSLLTGVDRGDDAGAAVAGAVDLDGDGLDDVIVGAPGAGDGRGAVYIALAPLRPSMSLDDVEYTVRGVDPGDAFGAAVVALERADAPPRVLASAPYRQGGQVALLATLPTATTLAGVDDVLFAAPDDAALGASLAPGGDVDGDGEDDVLVGAPGWPSAGEAVGAGLVWRGPFGGREEANALALNVHGVADGDAAGASIATAGDLDGNGLPEMLLGVPRMDVLYEDSGAAAVIYAR